MTDRKISKETHEAGNERPVKIIQIIQDLDPDSCYATLIGLGDDGVVYTSTWESKKWRKLVPLEFCEEGNQWKPHLFRPGYLTRASTLKSSQSTVTLPWEVTAGNLRGPSPRPWACPRTASTGTSISSSNQAGWPGLQRAEKPLSKWLTQANQFNESVSFQGHVVSHLRDTKCLILGTPGVAPQGH